uniref:Uncharacterized protein n=1 Tax=Strigamia maritima TaxID=126957 RepID=T1J9T6_STRMM
MLQIGRTRNNGCNASDDSIAIVSNNSSTNFISRAWANTKHKFMGAFVQENLQVLVNIDSCAMGYKDEMKVGKRVNATTDVANS